MRIRYYGFKRQARKRSLGVERPTGSDPHREERWENIANEGMQKRKTASKNLNKMQNNARISV